MLSFQKTRVVISDNRPVASGATIAAEGIALVADYTGGVFGVKPAAGTAGEQFVGIAVNQVQDATTMTYVEDRTVPATPGPYTLTLDNTPMAGELRVINAGTGVALTVVAGAPATGEVQWVSGTTLTFNAAQQGVAVKVFYRYALTVFQSISLQGNAPAGGVTAMELLSVSGVIEKGDVYTSEFEITDNWTANTPVYTGANGRLTTDNTSGARVGYVVGVPSSSAAGDQYSAMLGVSVQA